jgi:hypothetical protein
MPITTTSAAAAAVAGKRRRPSDGRRRRRGDGRRPGEGRPVRRRRPADTPDAACLARRGGPSASSGGISSGRVGAGPTARSSGPSRSRRSSRSRRACPEAGRPCMEPCMDLKAASAASSPRSSAADGAAVRAASASPSGRSSVGTVAARPSPVCPSPVCPSSRDSAIPAGSRASGSWSPGDSLPQKPIGKLSRMSSSGTPYLVKALHPPPPPPASSPVSSGRGARPPERHRGCGRASWRPSPSPDPQPRAA